MDDDGLSPPSPTLLAQMGFSTFGAAPSIKKRKYNPAIDAVTSSLPKPPPSLPKKPPGVNHRAEDWSNRRSGPTAPARNGAQASSGSGSNRMPLGRRKEKEHVTATSSVTGNGPPQEDTEDGSPGYVDETPPDSPGGNLRMRLGEAVTAVVARTEPGENEEEENCLSEVGSGQALLDAAEKTGLGGAAHTRPEDQTSTTEEGKATEGLNGERQYDWAALRKGIRMANGDMAYYNHSFVEDPWKELLAQRVKGG